MDLKELREQLDTTAALEAELEELEQRRLDLQRQVKLDRTNLEYEMSDVRALEDKTLKSVFYTVIGKKEERLEKEESEAEQAQKKYEDTSAELAQVEAEIKKISGRLQKLKTLRGSYKRLREDLPGRLREIEPLLSAEDAVMLEVTQKEILLQKKQQEYYTELTEECKKLSFSVGLVQESLRDMIDEDRWGTVIGEYAARRDAEKNRDLVKLQLQRLADCLQKGIKLENDYCLDIRSINNLIVKIVLFCSEGGGSPLAFERLSQVPDLGLNLQGLLQELERKLEKSERFVGDLEERLADLVTKYQSN